MNQDPTKWENCPECNCELLYTHEGKRYSKICGVEDPSKYDGVSWWKCRGCGATWDRWTMKLVKPGVY